MAASQALCAKIERQAMQVRFDCLMDFQLYVMPVKSRFLAPRIVIIMASLLRLLLLPSYLHSPIVPRFIRPKDDQPSPAKAFAKGHILKNILKTSEPIKHEAITSFSSLRQEVFEEIRQSDQIKVSAVTLDFYPSSHN